MTFGSRLRELPKAKGLSQRDNVSLINIERLALALDLSLSDLFGRVGKR